MFSVRTSSSWFDLSAILKKSSPVRLNWHRFTLSQAFECCCCSVGVSSITWRPGCVRICVLGWSPWRGCWAPSSPVLWPSSGSTAPLPWSQDTPSRYTHKHNTDNCNDQMTLFDDTVHTRVHLSVIYPKFNIGRYSYLLGPSALACKSWLIKCYPLQYFSFFFFNPYFEMWATACRKTVNCGKASVFCAYAASDVHQTRQEVAQKNLS